MNQANIRSISLQNPNKNFKALSTEKYNFPSITIELTWVACTRTWPLILFNDWSKKCWVSVPNLEIGIRIFWHPVKNISSIKVFYLVPLPSFKYIIHKFFAYTKIEQARTPKRKQLPDNWMVSIIIKTWSWTSSW